MHLVDILRTCEEDRVETLGVIKGQLQRKLQDEINHLLTLPIGHLDLSRPNPLTLRAIAQQNGFKEEEEILNLYFQDVGNSVIENAIAPQRERQLAELQLENYLCTGDNIQKLESGLVLLERQFVIPSGRLDILAQDESRRRVGVELKAAKDPSEKTIEQMQRYLKEEELKDARFLLVSPHIAGPVYTSLFGERVSFREFRQHGDDYSFYPVTAEMIAQRGGEDTSRFKGRKPKNGSTIVMVPGLRKARPIASNFKANQKRETSIASPIPQNPVMQPLNVADYTTQTISPSFQLSAPKQHLLLTARSGPEDNFVLVDPNFSPLTYERVAHRLVNEHLLDKPLYYQVMRLVFPRMENPQRFLGPFWVSEEKKKELEGLLKTTDIEGEEIKLQRLNEIISRHPKYAQPYADFKNYYDAAFISEPFRGQRVFEGGFISQTKILEDLLNNFNEVEDLLSTEEDFGGEQWGERQRLLLGELGNILKSFESRMSFYRNRDILNRKFKSVCKFQMRNNWQESEFWEFNHLSADFPDLYIWAKGLQNKISRLKKLDKDFPEIALAYLRLGPALYLDLIDFYQNGPNTTRDNEPGSFKGILLKRQRVCDRFYSSFVGRCRVKNEVVEIKSSSPDIGLSQKVLGLFGDSQYQEAFEEHLREHDDLPFYAQILSFTGCRTNDLERVIKSVRVSPKQKKDLAILISPNALEHSLDWSERLEALRNAEIDDKGKEILFFDTDREEENIKEGTRNLESYEMQVAKVTSEGYNTIQEALERYILNGEFDLDGAIVQLMSRGMQIREIKKKIAKDSKICHYVQILRRNGAEDPKSVLYRKFLGTQSPCSDVASNYFEMKARRAMGLRKINAELVGAYIRFSPYLGFILIDREKQSGSIPKNYTAAAQLVCRDRDLYAGIIENLAVVKTTSVIFPVDECIPAGTFHPQAQISRPAAPNPYETLVDAIIAPHNGDRFPLQDNYAKTHYLTRVHNFAQDMLTHPVYAISSEKADELSSAFTKFNLVRHLKTKEHWPTETQFYAFFDDVQMETARTKAIPNAKKLGAIYDNAMKSA